MNTKLEKLLNVSCCSTKKITKSKKSQKSPGEKKQAREGEPTKERWPEIRAKGKTTGQRAAPGEEYRAEEESWL